MDEFTKVCFVAAVLVLALAAVTYRIGYNKAQYRFQDEAVKRGAAQYQVDQSGNVRWSWKELDKEEK